ncbi:MAG: Eco57I restriction-modification methylase domain-containing protein, partial [Gemmatimonadales bacterium]
MLLQRGIAHLERKIAERLDAARERDLFGRRRGFTAEGRAAGRRLRASLHELRRAVRLLRKEGRAPFFSFETHFADVLRRGGFDLVAGNPPWVRAERLAPRVRETLAVRYSCWRPASGGTGYAHLPDLAVAFVERSLELVRPGGAAALLVPEKLGASGYAEALRHRLAHTTTVERAAPIGDAAARAFGAAVYPMVLVAVRRDPPVDTSVATTLGPKPDAQSVPQALLQRQGPWILQPDADRVARRLQASFPTVGERWSPQIGVKTGADDLFLISSRLPETRPVVRGRDIRPWRCAPSCHLLWT